MKWTQAMANEAKLTIAPKLRFPEFQEEPEWEGKEIDELLTIGSGRDYKHLSPGPIPVYGSGGYMRSVSDFLHEGDSVCIGRKGTIDKPMYLTGKFWTVDTLFYTHSFRGCTPKFIYNQFQLVPWLDHNEAGGIPSLSKTTIGKIRIPIPSIAEQQKIAECLSTLDELIGTERQKLDALKAHKKGLMQQLFPREGETLPRLRFPEFRNGPEWEEKSIGEFGDVITGSTPSTVKPEYYGGDIPFVSPADISELRFVDETKTTLTELGFEETRRIRASSVLFVCIGSTIGKVAQNARACATNQQINSVVPNSDHDGAFVYYALVKNADRVAKLAGKHAVPIVNKTLYSSVRLPVPEINEQQRIASCLSSLDDLIAAQSDQLEALKTHKKGLMQQLFPAPAEADG